MQTAGQIQLSPTAATQVTVHVADQMLRAGLLAHLSQAGVSIQMNSSRLPVDLSSTVAVVVSDRLDELSVAELRRLVRGGRRPVVLVTSHLREPELVKVLEIGVKSILWRHEATPERLAHAIRAAGRGHGDLPPDLLGLILGGVGRDQRGSAGTPAAYLSPREVSVLRLVADGLSTRQIARQLAYSERTVKNVLHAVNSRLNLANRAHAVAYALREGYL